MRQRSFVASCLFALAATALGCGDGLELREPTALDLALATPEDTAVAIDLTRISPVMDDLAYQLTAPVHGTLSGTAPVLTYTPAPDFVGDEVLQVTVTDGYDAATAAITITVQSVDDAPLAVDDEASTTEDTALTLAAIALTTNDTDIDGAGLTVVGVDAATNGTVALAAGSITFTPTADFVGTAGFDYTVSDGELQDIGHVAVTVLSAEDAPVATDDTATTTEDSTLTLAAAALLGNDNDADADSLTVTSVQAPSTGTVVLSGTTIQFTPAANFNGPASFTYTVSDGVGSDVGTVVVTVTSVNDAPVGVDDTMPPIERDTSGVIAVATLLADDLDVDGDVLSFGGVSSTDHGAVQVVGGTLRFTPDVGYVGPAGFTYTVRDPGGLSGTAVVTTSVHACGDGTLDAGEVCDDHNNVDGDGCSATCAREPRCGDGFTDAGEVCDDHNTDAGDGCRADCLGEEICGDGLVDFVTEECDDGDDTDPDDGCDACALPPIVNVPAQVISGELSCATNSSNTGRKITSDARGNFYAALRCEGFLFIGHSDDVGQTWSEPVATGLGDVFEAAIEGGDAGTAYVAAIRNAGPPTVTFTRTTDTGATWEAPQELDDASDAEVSIDASGDDVYVAVSTGSTGLRVFHNPDRGAPGSWTSVAVTQRNSFHDVIVDKLSGDVILASDDPAFHVRRSTDRGATFGAESNPTGEAFFSDWAGARGFVYATGTSGDDNIDVISLTTGASHEVHGLPTGTGAAPVRAIDADAQGNAYVVSQLDDDTVQLDRMVFGASSILGTDARVVGTGTAPGVGALPNSRGAVVVFTSGSQVLAGVQAY